MLKDKVVIVTGASRGIGRSLALTMSGQGAKLVLSARNAEALAQLVTEIQAAGGAAVAVAGDVSSAVSANELVDAGIQAFGRIDVLVNNAGITRDALLLRMKDEDWDDVLNINLKGAFLCTRAAAKVMSKQRYGRIIKIGRASWRERVC